MEYTEELVEVENRMKNLLWTVSGDYGMEAELDVEAFLSSKYAALYDAIKQGAFAKYFSREEYSLYLVKKIYFGADEERLMSISRLCVDMACADKICEERRGVAEVRKKAFSEVLDRDFAAMQKEEMIGKIKFAIYREALDGSYHTEKKVRNAMEGLYQLRDTRDTLDIIRETDRLYNLYVDREFEKQHGSLERVLAVTMEELTEFDWKDYLQEEMYEDMLERMMAQMSRAVTNLDNEKNERKHTRAGALLLNEEALEKMYSYIEVTYGESCQTELERKQLDRAVCHGAHADCSIYLTEGILQKPMKVNNTYVLAKRTRELNLSTYRQNTNVTKRNVEILSDVLKRAIAARQEPEFFSAEYGKIVPTQLWKIGRTREQRIFVKEQKKLEADFAVDLLIDASGSQQSRQNLVALQGFVVSRALSLAGIPHRVMSFCTFWDYTVLNRFRDYEDSREEDFKLFDFHASSNNRDGLAIRAAVDGLLKRQEENKILIVLSDGRPNDLIVNRPNAKNPKLYTGDYAVRDTALEVRKARGLGVSVLGVFMGEEQDLNAERKIFGKDFAYIKNISNFSNVVGTYLRRQLEE